MSLLPFSPPPANYQHGNVWDTPKNDALLRARREYAKLIMNGTPMDVMILGDSVTSGYNATTTGGYTYVELIQSGLKSAAGFPMGGIGYRPGTTLGYLSPRFITSAGSPSLNTIGYGLNSTFLAYGDEVTLTTTCDRLIMSYGSYNNSTNSYLEINDSVVGVITGAGLDTNDGVTGFPGRYDNVFDSTTTLGISQSRTITVRCKTDATKQAGGTFANMFFLDREGAGTFRVWNGGHFGSTTSDFLFNFNTDLIGANIQGLNAGLVIIALGLNETNPTTYGNNLVSLATQIINQCTTNIPPSFVFVTPWPTTHLSHTPAANKAYVNACYGAAKRLSPYGAAVFDAATVMGNIYNNYFQISNDTLHPNDVGDRMYGKVFTDWLVAALGV